VTVDRALSGVPFGIDQFRCRDAADFIGQFRPMVQEEPWTDLPRISQLVFKTLFVSICHQFNWDYLQTAMAGWLLPDPEKRLLELERVRSSALERLLKGYFKPERIQARQRARMLRSTASHLRMMLDAGQLRTLLLHRRLEGEGCFYDVIRGIPAFAEDELEKKSRVLAHDLYREGIIAFVDPQHLRPAVEYHILRLYVRTGRVYPTDSSVIEQLRRNGAPSRARLVRLLRKKVEEAMELTAFYANIDIATLNHVEWQIGRAICTSLQPRCLGDSPPDFPTDIRALSPHCCVYSKFCRAFNEPRYGWFYEPTFQKAIY
jgi:hypothetical protein